MNFDPIETAKESGFDLLSFMPQDAMLLKELAFYHNDPFDRMLKSQSMANKFPIMTIDSKFDRYDCKLD